MSFGNASQIAMYTAQKIQFSIKDFFGKCDQIRRNWPKFSFYGNKATDSKVNLNWFNEL